MKKDTPIYLRNHQPIRKSPLKNMRTLLFILFIIFVNYFVFFSEGEETNKPTINDRIRMPKIPNRFEKKNEIEIFPIINKDGEALKIVEEKIKKGETMLSFLSRLGVGERDALAGVNLLNKFIDLKSVPAGKSIEIVTSPQGSLLSLKYPVSKLSYFEVFKDKNVFDIKKTDVPIEVKAEKVGCVVMSSLYESMEKCGEDPELATLIGDILSWDIDFFKDVRKGDYVKAVVEKLYTNGTFLKYGEILAVEYNGKLGHHYAFIFKNKDGKTEYYNEDGISTIKRFLKAPLRYTRISSQFSQRRFHSILHKSKPHLAIEYRAPKGTPLWAIASGKIIFKARKGGYGNLIIIDHGDEIKSYYAQLEKFSKELKIGDFVEQKDLIGYVGVNGRATTPHLHFAISLKEKFIHPKLLKNVSVKTLELSLMQKWGEEVKKFKNELKNIPIKGFDNPTWVHYKNPNFKS